MIVEKELDLDAIEKTSSYNGLYFILGGLVPPLADKPTEIIRIRDTIDNACVFAYVLKSPSHGQMYVKLQNWSLSLRLGTQDTLSPWRSAFKLAFRTSADTLHHLPHEYETLHLTDLQFDRIAGLLHSIHTDLFAGGAEASSDPEALKQSYLLVK